MVTANKLNIEVVEQIAFIRLISGSNFPTKTLNTEKNVILEPYTSHQLGSIEQMINQI